jgi:hypothetical protein
MCFTSPWLDDNKPEEKKKKKKAKRSFSVGDSPSASLQSKKILSGYNKPISCHTPLLPHREEVGRRPPLQHTPVFARNLQTQADSSRIQERIVHFKLTPTLTSQSVTQDSLV